jgi:hypothetical protein
MAMDYNETMRVESVFQLSKNEYPERKRTTIVITDDGDQIIVGVKAVVRVYERSEGSAVVSVHQEQYGDYLRLQREDTLDGLFSCIKKLFDEIPEVIEKKNEDA